MKTILKTLAIVAVATSFATSSFASVQEDIRRYAGVNGDIVVQVSGDTITLNGYVEDSHRRYQAERLAKSQGFKVNNNLVFPN